MPLNNKNSRRNAQKIAETTLDMPAVGMEAEFNVWLDGVEIIPEKFWKHPSDFVDVPMLARTGKSSQLPTGGALYFDRGVIEVVTPVIELAEGCSARVVRNLWEQIGFVREQLTRWEKRTGHTVRLKAYSSHYNISYETPVSEQTRTRNEKRLALLLSYILPVPMMLLAANRRSTGIGVRPRGGRIEVTADFTPDPGLMIATAALVVGIVRELMTWDSYDLDLLRTLPIPTIEGVIPGKHTTRKGWLTKDFHYAQSPYTADIDAEIWKVRDGRTISLRQIGRETACFFKKSIRKWADPFSFRLLFAILEGRAPSMLELVDRPAAYEDVGRLCRWGMVIHELKSFSTELKMLPVRDTLWNPGSIDDFIAQRTAEKTRVRGERLTKPDSAAIKAVNLETPTNGHGNGNGSHFRSAPGNGGSSQVQASSAATQSLLPPRRRRSEATPTSLPVREKDFLNRRRVLQQTENQERRRLDRRKRHFAIPFPDRRLTRSAYESVFLKLVSGEKLKIGTDQYTPVGMKGWYHAIFRRDSDGRERLLTIDQLLHKMNDWR